MAGQDLGTSDLQYRENPNSPGDVYIAKRSFSRGTTPQHLKKYNDDFADAAQECSAEVDADEGMEAVKAQRQCVSEKLS